MLYWTKIKRTQPLPMSDSLSYLSPLLFPTLSHCQKVLLSREEPWDREIFLGDCLL